MAKQAHIVSFDDARRRSARAARSEQAPRRASRNDQASRHATPSSPGFSSGTLFADDDFYASLGFSDEGADSAASLSPAVDAGLGAPRSSSARAFAREEFARRSSPYGLEPSPRFERTLEFCEEDEPMREDVSDAADDAASRESGPLAEMRAKIRKAKRSKAKERAGKKFASQYGGDSSSADASAGPRAAVYKAEMGNQHKRAARLQDEGPGAPKSVRSASAGKPSGLRRVVSSKAFVALCGIAACLAFCCLFLYTPAQQYYQELRERDRLELEYAAVQERNDNLEASVDYLSTDKGVEDQAREEFGWVKDGEHAVSVSGVEVEEESNFTANVLSSDIKPPDTWYSGILDPFFGVE